MSGDTKGGPIVGVDVGGTFTDLFLFDPAQGTFRVAKVPSNRGDEAVGFMAGLRKLGGPAGFEAIVHGTTVGTNALLERKGAKLGVITTAGFRDVLEMRRRDRRNTWGLWGEFLPVTDRDLRVEVAERVLADGTIHTQMHAAEVQAAARELLARGAEACAIVFINAYANGRNEAAAALAVRAIWPNPHVSVSAEILPEIREFERASTTALNAYLQPVVASYLGKLERALGEDGFSGRFHIVQSNGGIMSTATARGVPVRTALSGPAAGVIAAAAIARAAGFENAITCDLGGTSFDVSLVSRGRMELAAQATIDFGLVIRSPMIEITTIGAGGGSIAQVDRGGLLQVGPESAGSRPGPVCYGQGNTRPTLTDANVVLGRINADKPIGGALARLDVEGAKAAIAEHVGNPLGLDAMQAAEAIVRVANAKMAGAIRLVSIERGHDPQKFVALPFGGGGALHVGALIKEVGLRAALVPRFPGVTSALGCVIADVRHDQVRTLNLNLAGIDAAALDARMVEEATAARAVVDGAGLPVTRTEIRFELDMHYAGQTHTVGVPLPVHVIEGTTGISEAIIRTAFEAAYQTAFSRLLPGLPMRIVSLRTAAIGVRPDFDLSALAPPADATVEGAARGVRQVWFDGAWHTAQVWSRLDLPVAARVHGPAILEQPDATVVVDPDLVARVDAYGNLIIERE
ncbi:hydantoinase/oxoprolinase family protein [Falsiroseomonas selenitidurans]|uniref:Hydantoinase/oxoprolinase family protein n=1 Tax=Falsiroseomonas selenitidurans TaxID=2716335 RepID=A0ABX1E709_9PROT|nr:hydantoinase/oxoprolinase family protein [Falsiroseomonas selenitidurans]NKC30715.1 hydantoinase/oxoprolinase family protein [Falsiroseomonas selenitidurans]